MNPEIKKIATPRVLRGGVDAYRMGKGESGKYILRMPKAGENLQIQAWQFFVLETLPECESFEALVSVFKDRYGHEPIIKEVEEFLLLLESKKFFGAGALDLPLLDSMNTWGSVRLSKEKAGTAGSPTAQAVGSTWPATAAPQLKSISGAADGSKSTSDQSGEVVNPDEVAGVSGAVGLDDRQPYRGFKLFDPIPLLRWAVPLLRPFRHIIYLLPFLLIAAAFVARTQTTALGEDFIRAFEALTFAKHVLLGMITVNLAAATLSALVAYHFRASVSGFYLIFYLSFLPRFSVRIGNAQGLSRRALIWLHASPLLLRLGFVGGGILFWYVARVRYETMALFGLAVASIGAISFMITANPLIKSNGFHLLATFVNEPRLRGKAFHAFMNKFGRKVYAQTDQNALAVYFMASVLFTFVFVVALIYFLQLYLNIYFGEGSLLLITGLSSVLAWRLVRRCQQIGKQYERAIQFQQWRNRTLPQVETDASAVEKSKPSVGFLKRALLVTIIAAMFLPYDYEVGGNFRVLPMVQQRISCDFGGIIETVNYDGGEFVSKGAIIGHLSNSEYMTQEKIFAAKVQEQTAIIEELKNQPRTEELEVALSELETQKTRTEFSRSKAKRLQSLYNSGTISLEDLEDARKEFEVDSNKIIEKSSNYKLIKAGAPLDEIAAAEAKLKAYEEERDFFRERIQKSIFTMPFDGIIVTTRLKDKIGSYLNKGEALAVVENLSLVKAEIEIPESDIAHVQPEARVRVRSRVNYDSDSQGKVLSIEQNVTEQRYGRVIKVVTLIDNSSGQLKTGMTGYAKIESQRMPLWHVVSMPLIRFVKVDLWSWLP